MEQKESGRKGDGNGRGEEGEGREGKRREGKQKPLPSISAYAAEYVYISV